MPSLQYQSSNNTLMQAKGFNVMCDNNSLNLPRFSKQMNSSASTSGSSSPRQFSDSLGKPSMYCNKEKSQLCKRFIESGFCPYENKCKFAHGSHQLRRNQEVNSKYKTKQCGVYIKQGYCPYGQRCNFIHEKVKTKHEFEGIDEELIAIKSFAIQQSRLLKLLD